MSTISSYVRRGAVILLLTASVAVWPAQRQALRTPQSSASSPPSRGTSFLPYHRSEPVAPGITYSERRFFLRDDGPFTLQLLEIDPKHPAINLLAVRADDRAIGKETVGSMAKRYGATAAVNGGYFVVSGPYAGVSNGVYQLNGIPISSGSKRSALLFCQETNYQERAEMDVVNFRGTATAANGSTLRIAKLNGQRGSHDLVLYRAPFGPTTLTDSFGAEAILDATGRVIRLEDGVGNAVVPSGGMVLSGAGRSAGWLRQHAAVGARLRTAVGLTPRAPQVRAGCKAEAIIGGGPRLVRHGKINITGEAFRHTPVRHPRTAFAITRRGTFLFMTLDGRQPSSAGMTLRELGSQLIEMGAVEAINLDGGGSTTMVVNDVVRNSPSDGHERAVSDAILIFSVADLNALASLIERLGNGQISAGLLPRMLQIVQLARQDRRELDSLIRLIDGAASADITTAAAAVLREAAAGLRQRTGGNGRGQERTDERTGTDGGTGTFLVRNGEGDRVKGDRRIVTACGRAARYHWSKMRAPCPRVRLRTNSSQSI